MAALVGTVDEPDNGGAFHYSLVEIIRLAGRRTWRRLVATRSRRRVSARRADIVQPDAKRGIGRERKATRPGHGEIYRTGDRVRAFAEP